MSASQDKKKRTQQRAEGTERRQVAAQKQTAEKKKEKLRWTLGTILVVVLIAGILLGNSSLFYRQTAAKVGDETYSAAQMNYYYNTAYQNWYSQYGSYASYLYPDLDMTQPIASQPYTASDEFETWGDYFMNSAKESVKQVTALSSAAKEAGMTLSEADKAQIDEQIQSIKDGAKSAGFGSAAKYLQAIFGVGVNESIVRQEMERSMLASNFAEEQQKSFTYTKDQLKDEYAEHADEYDLFDGMYYFVAAETEEVEGDDGETTQQPTDETMAAAKETADKMLAAVNEAEAADKADAFTKIVSELGTPVDQTDENGEATGKTDPAEPVTMEKTAGSNVSNQSFAEWMLDSARKAGDASVIEQENGGYYVVLFQNREINDGETVNVRHILIRPVDADEDGTISDEEKQAAEDQMADIQAEWEAGEKTEDAFAALANKYSEDPGSNTNGGLYENVYEGQMVTEFNDFCFADGRKAGDVELVYSESTGYHLIYFVGTGMPYCDYVADNLLRSEDYSEWQESFLADWEVVETRGMKYVG